MSFKTNFVLSVSGVPSVHSFSISLSQENSAEAEVEAIPLVKQLSKAGYTSFVLYDVRNEDAICVTGFKVWQNEPTVSKF